MQTRTDLPPLAALLAFDAAARTGSFTAAARTLGATQPAISQQVAALEADLGRALFRRRAQGVALTPEGRVFAEAVEAALATLARATATLRRARGQGLLTVGTDYGFAGLWLMPRLGALAARLPETEVRVVAAQTVPDPCAGEVDVAIGMLAAPPAGAVATPLFGERVRAVAGAGYVARHPELAEARALPAQRLLHLESRGDAPWLSWPKFLAALGLASGRREGDMRFNTYPLVIQATLADQGVALGWEPLVADLLAEGRLVGLTAPVATALGYGLIEPAERRSEPAIAAFRGWLLEARGSGFSPL